MAAVLYYNNYGRINNFWTDKKLSILCRSGQKPKIEGKDSEPQQPPTKTTFPLNERELFLNYKLQTTNYEDLTQNIEHWQEY